MDEPARIQNVVRRLMRRLPCALAVLGLAACGGEVKDAAPNDATGGGGASATGGMNPGSGGASGGATSGGAPATGGATSGGAPSNGGEASGGAATGGDATGGEGGTMPAYGYSCVNWSDIENAPLPGKSGIEACPSFYELDYVEPQSPYCVFFAEPPDPTVPTGADAPSGDCCYGLTYLHCR